MASNSEIEALLSIPNVATLDTRCLFGHLIVLLEYLNGGAQGVVTKSTHSLGQSTGLLITTATAAGGDPDGWDEVQTLQIGSNIVVLRLVGVFVNGSCHFTATATVS